jgi:hypothetical protein
MDLSLQLVFPLKRRRSRLSVVLFSCWIMAGSFGVCVMASAALAAQKLAVYYGSVASVKEREKMLRSQLGLEEVVVFARARDFYQLLDQDPPAVVIAPSLLNQIRQDYVPILQFKSGGSAQFRYRLISLSDKKLDAKKPESFTIGMIEEVDRVRLKQYFKDSVGINISKMNTVPKAEDLFPLLVFNAADAILVSEDNFTKMTAAFSEKTNDLKVEVKPVSYPQVFVKKGLASDWIKKIEMLSSESLSVLGYEAIERIKE